MNSAAFLVITMLTLAAALAAATLPKLVHAALSFAAAFRRQSPRFTSC